MFSLCSDIILRGINDFEGIKVNGVNINNIINIAGIIRMSTVTIFQPDRFVLSTIYFSNLTFRSLSYWGAKR